MCDKEFKELVKIAVEKLKDESVLKLLQADVSYQTHEYLTAHTVREIHKLLRNAFNQGIKW